MAKFGHALEAEEARIADIEAERLAEQRAVGVAAQKELERLDRERIKAFDERVRAETQRLMDERAAAGGEKA